LREDSGNCVLILDAAPCHKTKEVKDQVRHSNVELIFSLTTKYLKKYIKELIESVGVIGLLTSLKLLRGLVICDQLDILM
jgi:hypothetical protein